MFAYLFSYLEAFNTVKLAWYRVFGVIYGEPLTICVKSKLISDESAFNRTHNVLILKQCPSPIGVGIDVDIGMTLRGVV